MIWALFFHPWHAYMLYSVHGGRKIVLKSSYFFRISCMENSVYAICMHVPSVLWRCWLGDRINSESANLEMTNFAGSAWFNFALLFVQLYFANLKLCIVKHWNKTETIALVGTLLSLLATQRCQMHVLVALVTGLTGICVLVQFLRLHMHCW